jgi:acylphosphatase
MKRVHLIISGSVVGVFFRNFVRTNAEKLGLTGFVKNLDDSVEVVCEGSETDLLELVRLCKLGPSSSRVSNVSVKWSDYNNEFDSFSTNY